MIVRHSFFSDGSEKHKYWGAGSLLASLNSHLRRMIKMPPAVQYQSSKHTFPHCSEDSFVTIYSFQESKMLGKYFQRS